MKFIQVATGTYQMQDKRYNHVVYGLGDDGNIYSHSKASGWVSMGKPKEIPAKVVSQPKSSRVQNVIDDDDVPF